MLPIKPTNIQSPGNKDVVAMLERWLERARAGRTNYMVIVAVEGSQLVLDDYAGSPGMEFAANWGLDTAKLRMQERVHSRHLKPLQVDTSASADRVCYNVSTGPACYDFIAWLIIAEMNRIRQGAPAPLKVGFRMVDSEDERARHEKFRKAFYANVIKPSLAFVGAVEDPSCESAPEIERYTFSPIVEAAKQGEAVPMLRPSQAALDTMGYVRELGAVTITLREADYWEFRNSNVPEWIKFARWLVSQGETVVFVRDTARADEPLDGFPICPQASRDLDMRLALYESARCNLFVSNGPFSLALFGTKPWLMFVETSMMSPFFPETPQFYAQWHGIDPKRDEQFPWSKPDQRIIWKRDTFENLKAAWEQHLPLLTRVDAAA